MSIYRNIVAVMAAIVIASPLCCCALPSPAPENASEKSCCSQKETTQQSCPGGQSCPECRAKDPRQVDAGKVTVNPVLSELAPLSLFAVVPELKGGVTVPCPSLDLPDPGPPGWRLVLHQIFLI